MAANFVFYYFGDDEAYFKALSGEFRQRTKLIIDFKRIYETDEKKIQSLFLKIYKNKPACVFIDFSKNTQDYLHLARIISRTPMEHTMVAVGLVDYLSPPEVIKESLATGLKLTHIKSAEVFDVVFDVTKLVAPQEIGEHGYATASLSEDWEGGIPCKVGYIHPEGLHIETDYKVSPGDRLKVAHHWVTKKTVPSKEVFVKAISSSNMFYHFNYNVDVDFLFVDEFLPPEGMEDDTIAQKKQERDDAIKYSRKQLKLWIEDNLSRSQEKVAKVLIIDREFHFYQNQPRTDKHPYIIRCFPVLQDIGTELDRLQPQVIAFSLEDDSPQAKNTIDEVNKLVEGLKAKFPDKPPFLLVFNCETPSKELQGSLGYQNTMAIPNELSAELLVRMADIFEKKLAASKVIGVKETDKIFMKKNNDASFCEIMVQIKVNKISETDMIFQSEVPLPPGINLHLTKPVNMFVMVNPAAKSQSKTPEYHGLIHCLGEVEKKELRRFVNSIFFREHDEKKQTETDEFKKLNETKQQEKTKAQEAAAEAAAEEAEESGEEKESNS